MFFFSKKHLQVDLQLCTCKCVTSVCVCVCGTVPAPTPLSLPVTKYRSGNSTCNISDAQTKACLCAKHHFSFWSLKKYTVVHWWNHAAPKYHVVEQFDALYFHWTQPWWRSCSSFHYTSYSTHAWQLFLGVVKNNENQWRSSRLPAVWCAPPIFAQNHGNTATCVRVARWLHHPSRKSNICAVLCIPIATTLPCSGRCQYEGRHRSRKRRHSSFFIKKTFVTNDATKSSTNCTGRVSESRCMSCESWLYGEESGSYDHKFGVVGWSLLALRSPPPL